MRLILSSMNKGMLKLGNRELDCAELQLGTLKRETLYHCAHICSVLPIFAQFRSVRRHWKRSVAEDTKQYFVSERKKRCGPGDHLSSREQGHDHVRREHWHPARILSVGI